MIGKRFVSIKMGRITFPQYKTVAVLFSLTMHGVILLFCSLSFTQAFSPENYQPITVALVSPLQAGERRAPAPGPAADDKGAFGEEEKKSVGESIHIRKEGEAGIPEDRVESFPVKGGEEKETTLLHRKKEQGTPDVPAQSVTVLSLRQKPETEPASAPGTLLSYLPARGRMPGDGTFSPGTMPGKTDGGKMAAPGYAQGEASTGGGLTFTAAPRYRENSLPAYPLPARRRGYAGVVMLSVEVLTDGSVGHLEMKKSSGYELLDRSALETVRGWKFSPARKAGTPVTMWVDVPVRFTLN
jgi:TonB family protein